MAEIINNKYELHRDLPASGMGRVWEAKQLSGGAPVALKFIVSSAMEQPELVSRFRQEIELVCG